MRGRAIKNPKRRPLEDLPSPQCNALPSGLLALPPLRRPSHPDGSGQWHLQSRRGSLARRAGSQRRVRAGFAPASVFDRQRAECDGNPLWPNLAALSSPAFLRERPTGAPPGTRRAAAMAASPLQRRRRDLIFSFLDVLVKRASISPRSREGRKKRRERF